MNRRSEGVRVSLTPAGAGVFSLFFPGLLICAVARHRLLLAVSIGAGLILLANMVIARLALRRLVIDVRSPSIATVDTPITLMVDVSGASSPLECSVGLEHGARGWIPALVPTKGEVAVAFSERGSHETLAVRVRTLVPFGLTSVVRTVAVELSEALHVAPASVSTTVPEPPAVALSANPDGGGEALGLRVYVPGDPQRDVHWPTVARTGTMMVRDRRTETLPSEVTVSVGYLGNDDDFDIALGRVRATVERLMSSGHIVLLSTIDGPQRKPLTGHVRSSADLAARLARAQRVGATSSVAGSSGSATGHMGQNLVVDRDGARWQLGS